MPQYAYTHITVEDVAECRSDCRVLEPFAAPEPRFCRCFPAKTIKGQTGMMGGYTSRCPHPFTRFLAIYAANHVLHVRQVAGRNWIARQQGEDPLDSNRHHVQPADGGLRSWHIQRPLFYCLSDSELPTALRKSDVCETASSGFCVMGAVSL